MADSAVEGVEVLQPLPRCQRHCTRQVVPVGEAAALQRASLPTNRETATSVTAGFDEHAVIQLHRSVATARPAVEERDTGVPAGAASATEVLLRQPRTLGCGGGARIPLVQAEDRVHAEGDSAGAVHTSPRPAAEDVRGAVHVPQFLNDGLARKDSAVGECHGPAVVGDEVVAEAGGDLVEDAGGAVAFVR